MSMPTFSILPFDRAGASDAEYAAFNAFSNRLRAEGWPDDPPISLEETIRNMRNTPPFVEIHAWAAWTDDGREIIATGNVAVPRAEENRHLAFFGIGVLPQQRRRGLGTRFLEQIAAVATAQERRLLMTHTDGNVPAGEAFMQRLGARLGQKDHTNQLELADLDRDLLRRWQERARERAGGLVIGLWESPYPEGSLAEVAAMKQAMNFAPRDDLEVDDWRWTPEQLRQEDESMMRRKVERWTMYVRDPASGEIAGYTETFWNPERPEILNQGDTGVFPHYRSRGIGRWLKAAMLEKVLRDRPQVRRVRTGNADSNAAMLSINTELGFKPYKSWSAWQVEVSRVLDYLAACRARSARA